MATAVKTEVCASSSLAPHKSGRIRRGFRPWDGACPCQLACSTEPPSACETSCAPLKPSWSPWGSLPCLEPTAMAPAGPPEAACSGAASRASPRPSGAAGGSRPSEQHLWEPRRNRRRLSCDAGPGGGPGTQVQGGGMQHGGYSGRSSWPHSACGERRRKRNPSWKR